MYSNQNVGIIAASRAEISKNEIVQSLENEQNSTSHLNDNISRNHQAFAHSDNSCNYIETPNPDIQEHYSGQMNILCQHCNAKHFKAEKVANKKNSFHDCCSHGEVILEPLPDPPPILKSLFDGTHEQSKHFHERIRCYNNTFAFASFNANLVKFNNNRRPGPFCFKIHGQVYYQVNTSLYPHPNESPSYGQLFIVDQSEASDIRCNKISTLNREIVDAIDNVLRNCNLFAQSYRMMHEEIEQAMMNNNVQSEPEMK